MSKRKPPFLDALNVPHQFGEAEGLGHEGIGTEHQGMLEIACFHLGREDDNGNLCKPFDHGAKRGALQSRAWTSNWRMNSGQIRSSRSRSILQSSAKW
jgi:hypothetical protein